MQSEVQSIHYWEKRGVVFILLIGSCLHFVFEWSGRWVPLALIAAVNESVWEHLKLAFWPGILWTFIESQALKINKLSLWAIKAYSLLIPMLFIPAAFYIYTRVVGSNFFIVDISLFIIAVILAQLCSMRLLLRDSYSKTVVFFGLLLLMLQLVLFSLFTFFPPDHALFIEERTGMKGMF